MKISKLLTLHKFVVLATIYGFTFFWQINIKEMAAIPSLVKFIFYMWILWIIILTDSNSERGFAWSDPSEHTWKLKHNIKCSNCTVCKKTAVELKSIHWILMCTKMWRYSRIQHSFKDAHIFNLERRIKWRSTLIVTKSSLHYLHCQLRN